MIIFDISTALTSLAHNAHVSPYTISIYPPPPPPHIIYIHTHL
jgi:hypothetical protein